MSRPRSLRNAEVSQLDEISRFFESLMVKNSGIHLIHDFEVTFIMMKHIRHFFVFFLAVGLIVGCGSATPTKSDLPDQESPKLKFQSNLPKVTKGGAAKGNPNDAPPPSDP
jgi:hypothetical protein